jgi:hypothetical protein
MSKVTTALDDIMTFVEGLDILNSTLCIFAEGFQGLSKAFHYAKNAS